MSNETSGEWSAHPQERADQHPAQRELGDDGRTLDPLANRGIVLLGALCGISPPAAGDDVGVARFWVAEFAVLSNGRRVILSDDRGFSFSGPIGPTASPLTIEDIVNTVRVVVLPDPDDGEPHSWSDLAASAGRRGIDVTALELRHLPYEIGLTAELTHWLHRAN